MIIIENGFLRTVRRVSLKFDEIHLICSDNSTIALGGLFVDYTINMPQEYVFMVLIHQSKDLVTSKTFRVINLYNMIGIRIIIHEQLSSVVTFEQFIKPILVRGYSLKQFIFAEAFFQSKTIYSLKNTLFNIFSRCKNTLFKCIVKIKAEKITK